MKNEVGIIPNLCASLILLEDGEKTPRIASGMNRRHVF